MPWATAATFFEQPVKSEIRTFENIRKIATGQGDDYTTGCFLDNPWLCLIVKENYRIIAIDLSKQQTVNADPKEIDQVNLLGILGRAGNTTTISSLSEKSKKLT